jgi:hypothetical protein
VKFAACMAHSSISLSHSSITFLYHIPLSHFSITFLYHILSYSFGYIFSTARGYIQNILDWCRHLYSSCGSAKNRYIVRVPCLVSPYAKLHVAGWTWAAVTRVYLLFLWFLERQSGIFWISPRVRVCIYIYILYTYTYTESAKNVYTF